MDDNRINPVYKLFSLLLPNHKGDMSYKRSSPVVQRGGYTAHLIPSEWHLAFARWIISAMDLPSLHRFDDEFISLGSHYKIISGRI